MKENKNDFGLPEVDNTPVGLVEMEGRFFRGMIDNSKKKSVGLRIGIIVFSTMVLLIPGFSLLGIVIYLYPEAYKNNEVMTLISPTIVGIFLILCGFFIIKANLKNN